jgi:Mg-chelatase subunit ChlD
VLGSLWLWGCESAGGGPDPDEFAAAATSDGADTDTAMQMDAARPMTPTVADAGEEDTPRFRFGAQAPNVDAIFETGCATESMQSQLLPSNLLFVLDRSASMACNPPPTTESAECESDPVRADAALASKWEIVRAALLDAIRALPSSTNVGISYFSNDDACGVQSNPSVPLSALDGAQLATIDASLSNVEPEGATPLVGATVLAYKYLHEQALAREIRGKKYVVLLTDGEQSEPCYDDGRCDGASSCTDLLVNEEVAKAAGPGVHIATFVIGAPGSEPARSVLSQIALVGGTAPAGCEAAAGNCHFDMTTVPAFDEALEETLQQIAGRTALTCELPAPTAEDGRVDPSRVNVVYSPTFGTPEVIAQDDGAPCGGGADGWQYNEDETQIRLCGPICNRVRRDRAGRVDVVLGCPVQRPQ